MNNQLIEVIARAIIADDTGTKILFCAPKNQKYFYLPGGHIKFGETAESALERELYEEIGADATAELHFSGTEENIFTQENELRHEINVYFEIRGLFSGSENILSLEKDISFHWLALADISNLPVFPNSLSPFFSEWETGKKISWEK